MQLITKFNNRFRFLSRVADIYSKCEQLFYPLKDEKGVAITNAFKNILDESNRKPNKIWLEKGSKFCNRSMKSFLQNNDTEVCSAHNKGKYVIAERFIKTLKIKFINT